MTVEEAVVTGSDNEALTLVRRLVDDELASIASDVDADRLDFVLGKLHERGVFQRLIREQYSGRYPFELLQNANDAAAARLADGYNRGLRVRFTVGQDALLVADQGIGFGAAEIRAICGFGRSSKDPRKSIGYKGLGFKSVGEICDTPQIICVDMRFGFDPNRVRRRVEEVTGPLDPTQPLPTFAFPFELDPGDLGSDSDLVDELIADGFRTILRLPYRADVSADKVAKDVMRTIRPELLLFLPATGQLEVVGTPADFAALSDRETADNHDVVLLAVGEREEYWHVFAREVKTPSLEMMSKLKDAWADVEAVHVRAAVRLDADDRPDVSEVFPLSVYFPTEEKPGFPLLLQADFNLDLDRRFIKRSPESEGYNTWLADQLGRLIGEVVAPSLARTFPGDPRAIDVISPRPGATDHGAEISNRVIEHLRTSRFVPCVDGGLRIPGEVLLLPSSLPSPDAALELMNTEGHGRLVTAAAQQRPFARRLLAESLEVPALENGKALELLSPTGPDQLDQLYRLLVDWSAKIGVRPFAELARKLPLVLTQTGGWRPASENLYFPRGRDDPEIFDDLPVEVVVVPEVDGAADLLTAMGVQAFLWRTVLLRQVLPILSDPDASEEAKASNWALLRTYFAQSRGGDQDVVQRARNVLLPAAPARGGHPTLKPASKLYFSPAWLGHDRLQQIYGPFEESEFLALPPPADSEEREVEFRLLEWLGVGAHPRVFSAITTQKGEYKWENNWSHPHRELDGELWEAWVRSPEVSAAASCSQSHGSSQQIRASHALDRIRQVIESADLDRLAALFRELSGNWADVYGPCLKASFYCQHSYHSGPDKQRETLSLLGFSLSMLPWIVIVEDDELALASPSQAWRLSSEVSRRVAGMVPALRPDLDTPDAVPMCVALGVVDSGRASTSDLLRLLRRLAEHHQAAADEDPSIFDTARWVLGRLNDLLEKEPPAAEDLADLPMPAFVDGALVFVPDPYFCDDPELERAWADLPILHGGTDLSRLRQILDLKDLSKAVQTLPRPLGIDNVLSAQLTTELRHAAPFLAAVASKAASYRDETIFPRLARIEVLACEELALSYVLDEVERPHKGASSYLLSRTERVGSQSRTYATAYLEIDPQTRRPIWYGFGPQLAEHIRVPSVRDAFTMILKDPGERLQLLAARGIDEDDLEAARQELAKRSEEPEFEVVVKANSAPLQTSSTTTTSAQDESQPAPSATTDGGPDQDETSTEEPPPADVDSQEDEDALLLPPVDLEGLELEAAPHGRLAPGTATRRGGGGSGPGGQTDWERVARVTGAVGRWGEELVYELERDRLSGLGFDPEAVDWRSRREEFSPYDIRSLDAEGQVIFVEVKATTQTDPNTPFEITHDELDYAFQYRARYHIYRVLGVGTGQYRVIDFDDPAGRLVDGEASFRFTSGRLYLTPPPEPM